MTEWFVRNARDARWLEDDLGAYCSFEEEGERFPELGINLSVLQPGRPMAMYHRESHQEDFLVLRGECLLIAEGEERPLRQWDFVHCPPHVAHVIVGAGEGPSYVLAVGSRLVPNEVLYPVDPVALEHEAGVEIETAVPAEAYAGFAKPSETPFRDEFLPD
jgi:uncharacterized cupin superfamily protein